MGTNKRAFISICIVCSSIYLAGMIGPSLAYIVSSYPNVPVSSVMSLLTIPGIVAMFVSFGIGPLSLKINKKYLMLISLSSALVYYAVFVLVGDRGPFAFLLAGACILGIIRGSGSTLVNAMIGDFVEPEKRASKIALTSAILHGGAGITALLGGMIAAGNDGSNWPFSFLLGFISIPVMIVFAIMMPKKPDKPDLNEREVRCEKDINKDSTEKEEGHIKKGIFGIPLKVFVVIMMHFIFMICLAAYFLNSSIYIIIEHELGTSADAGLVGTSFTVTAVIIGLTYGVWDKYIRKWIVPLSYTFAIFGFISMLIFTKTIAGIWSAAFLLSLGMNLAGPYIISWVMSMTPTRLAPVSISVYMGCMNLGMFLAPYILSFTGSFLGGGITGALRTATILMPICVVASLFIFTFTSGRKRQRVKSFY